MSKASTEWKTTTNSSVYKRSIKIYRAFNKLIRCDFCPYHRVENEKRSERIKAKRIKRYPQHYGDKNVSWKAKSKKRRQYS